MAKATQQPRSSVEKGPHAVQVDGVGIECIFWSREDQQRDRENCYDEEHQLSGSFRSKPASTEHDTAAGERSCFGERENSGHNHVRSLLADGHGMSMGSTTDPVSPSIWVRHTRSLFRSATDPHRIARPVRPPARILARSDWSRSRAYHGSVRQRRGSRRGTTPDALAVRAVPKARGLLATQRSSGSSRSDRAATRSAS